MIIKLILKLDKPANATKHPIIQRIHC